MKQSLIEPIFFYRHFSFGILLLLVWVDDIWAAFTYGCRDSIFEPFWTEYTKRYPCKRLGRISRFVGIDITQSASCDAITLSMESFLTSMVPKYLSNRVLDMEKAFDRASLYEVYFIIPIT